jgi:hypothetical protein
MANEPSASNRRSIAVVAALVVVGALVAAVAWWPGDDAEQLTTGGTTQGSEEELDPAADDAAGAVVRVGIEPVEGFFVEGFEVALRFEGADGTVLASRYWSDWVQESGGEEIDGYYSSELDQPVPVGTVTVHGQATIGPGGPPERPALGGNLPCVLELDLEAGDVATVQVVFESEDDCLRLVGIDGPDGPEVTTEPADPTTTVPERTQPPATTGPLEPTTTVAAPTPPDGPREGAGELVLGSEHYVDVDLDCRAFFLGDQLFVLEEGDPRSWQPDGEPFEGGTFTYEGDGRGTFRGDAAGTKVATFRIPGPAEDWSCAPQTRP